MAAGSPTAPAARRTSATSRSRAARSPTSAGSVRLRPRTASSTRPARSSAPASSTRTATATSRSSRTRPPRARSARASRPRSSATAAGATRPSRPRPSRRSAAACTRSGSTSRRSPGRPSASTSSSSRTSATRRTSPGSSATTRSGSPRASPARRRPPSSMAAMEGFVHEAMQSGALGMSTGLEFNPGREATAEELMRLNAVAGRVRRHLHEPHPQPRLGPARGDRRVPRGRPGGEHESRDLAPERPPQHERARAGLGARGREDGGEPRDRARRPRRHDARSARASARWPGSCRRGWPRTGRRPRRRSCATRRCASGCATRATATGASSTRASGSACYFQATPQYPDLGGLNFRQISETARQGPVGLLPRHPRRRRHGLRGDPHGRDALHRRAPGGDDRPSALLPRRRHLHRPGQRAAERDHEAPARLRRTRPLPHPPRARAGHAAPGGGDPEDDEHAGGALRPLGSRPAAGGLQRRRRRVRLGRARRRLDARESDRVRTRDRARPRQRRPRRRRRRAHGRAAGPSPPAPQ